MDDLADRFHVSAPYLSRVIKENVGITFMEFTGKLRFNKAKQLLKSTNKSISEIAELSGFSTRSSFTRSFTEHAGMTLTQYRKTVKN